MSNAFKARARSAVRVMALFTGAAITLAAAVVGLHLAANWELGLARNCPPTAAAASAAPAQPMPATLEQEKDASALADDNSRKSDDDTDPQRVVGVAASTVADVVVVWSRLSGGARRDCVRGPRRRRTGCVPARGEGRVAPRPDQRAHGGTAVTAPRVGRRGGARAREHCLAGSPTGKPSATIKIRRSCIPTTAAP